MGDLQERFYKEFPNLKGNKVVGTFLEKPEHQWLLDQYIRNPGKKQKEQLDDAFKRYYFGIRFTSYVSSSLYFHSVNFDKKVRRFEERNVLTLDQSAGDEEGTSFKDRVEDVQEPIDFQNESLSECIEDERLLKAYESLTEKQKRVLDLAYVKEWKDVEIAKVLGTSQQAVSKVHQHALKNLKEKLTNGKE